MATRKKEDSVAVSKKEVATVRKFTSADMIPCVSVTSGVLLMTGKRTNDLYRWVDYEDVVDVAYDDLMQCVKRNSDYIKHPLFIIKDDDFIAQNATVKKLYDSMYSMENLTDVLNDNVDTMRAKIVVMPDNAKNVFIEIASSAIASGELDSVNKIKVIDELFGTDLLMRLAN